MRQKISIILAVLLCLAAAAGLAEGAPGGAVLTFSSFDGGGHEYSVEIDDPALLTCTLTRDYGSNHDPLEDGSPYTATLAFQGLRPGSTTVIVLGRSPILENDDHLYTATVDDALNVTLTPVRAISTFYLYRSGDAFFDIHSIARDGNGYSDSINDGAPQPIDTASVEALMGVVDAYGLEGWDGFDDSREDVLDGESFWLEFRLTDGTHICARGDNAFPEHYHQAMGEIQDILDSAQIGTQEETTMKLTINDIPVPVTWEDNPSVTALKALLPLKIRMSMYGGFEQVGAIGESLPREDRQTTTAAGDIVLYSGNQIVIFYGSNSWAYTRLGHVDLSAAEMEALLGDGDVVLALSAE